MANQRTNKWIKVALQLAIAALAIYFVLDSLDVDAFIGLLTTANGYWLLLAFLCFNASKILSAIRLNYYFRAIGLNLSERFNLKLYYLGMLYNQFLPGGIGGDGYKVYLLNKTNGAPVKKLISATLLDRISGVIALLFLVLILGFLGNGQKVIGDLAFLLWLGLILIYPLFYLFVKYIFSSFKNALHTTNLQALGVQVMQLICAFCILKGIGVSSGFVDYMALFLVTSVAAALPIALPGGIGVREAIFAFGYSYFMIEQTASVALASLFFLITLVSALFGLAFLDLRSEKD